MCLNKGEKEEGEVEREKQTVRKERGSLASTIRTKKENNYTTFSVPNKEENIVIRVLLVKLKNVSDKISVLGGTIGLFTGMSILSGFEVLFWMAALVTSILGRPIVKVD